MKDVTRRRFIKTGIGVGALAAVTAGLNVAAYSFEQTLDTYVGRGEITIETIEGSEDWDTAYYELQYESQEEACEHGLEVAKQIADEGIVLLKNDGVLPLASGTTVSPFGYRYIDPIYGGAGSGSITVDSGYTQLVPAIEGAFSVNDATVSAMEAATVVRTAEADGTTVCVDDPSITYLEEYDASIYEGTESSCTGTTGLVFIGRGGGENADLKRDGYEDGTPHQLALSVNEKATIAFAKANCDAVVAILNLSNLIECGPLMSGDYEVDAILWIGAPGSRGFAAMADILAGEVNPSGRTVDTWTADHTKNPTYVNFGYFEYNNVTDYEPFVEAGGAADLEGTFVEYEEGIYLGYRYYETAAVMDSSFDYDSEVVFPFGYGLSYCDLDGGFSQEISGTSEDDTTITVDVLVSNNSATWAGKTAVELYVCPPYTDTDAELGIEKSAVVLVGYGKTGELEPGATETVSVTISKDDLTSYAYQHENDNGTTGCYVLEAGDYTISLRSDSHTELDSVTYTVDSTIWYDGSDDDHIRQSEKDGQSMLDDEGNPTSIPAGAEADTSVGFVAATNQLDELNAYMANGKVTNLSRADWTGTFPTAPTDADCTADDDVLENFVLYGINTFDPETNPLLGNVEGSKVYTTEEPTANAANGISFSSMRGLSYYDSLWDTYLDQMDYSDSDAIDSTFYKAAFQVAAYESLDIPKANNFDGPQYMNVSTTLSDGNTVKVAYPGEVVIASTWNTDLAYDFGEAAGQDNLAAITYAGSGIQVWYAPALNLHRSPFAGRCYEYYSEDPYVSGAVTTATVEGAMSAGTACGIKHFAINEQEETRKGVATWCTEQAARELYLKPFEMAAKNARASIKYISDTEGTMSTKVVRGLTLLMASMNKIGTQQAAGCYATLTAILRNEWGFQGYVQSDLPGECNFDMMTRAGCDVYMGIDLPEGFGDTFDFDTSGLPDDIESATYKTCLRQAAKNIVYTLSNCNLMQGVAPGSTVSYATSPWKNWLLYGDVAVGAIVAGLLGWAFYKGHKESKEDEVELVETTTE